MKQRMKFIALRATRVGDSRTILNAYSPEFGRIAIISPIGKKLRDGARRTALMPMSVVECQASRRSGSEFFSISEPHQIVKMNSIYAHPLKSVVAQFIAEFLSLTLREQPADTILFDFIAESVERLEIAENGAVANFHLCFIIKLASFLGIDPDWSTFRPGSLFNMSEGVFRDVKATLLLESGPSSLLNASESEALFALHRMTFNNLQFFHMTRVQRNSTLDYLLRYYTMHYASLSSLKSLDILRSLF